MLFANRGEILLKFSAVLFLFFAILFSITDAVQPSASCSFGWPMAAPVRISSNIGFQSQVHTQAASAFYIFISS